MAYAFASSLLHFSRSTSNLSLSLYSWKAGKILISRSESLSVCVWGGGGGGMGVQNPETIVHFFARYSCITQQDGHTDTQHEEEGRETRPSGQQFCC